MVKSYTSKFIYPYPWETVARIFWLKYPNPESKHVLSEDTLQRFIQDGKLYSKRLITKTSTLPNWSRVLFSWKDRQENLKIVGVIEESTLDPKEKVLTTLTQNIGYSARFLKVIEKVVYKTDQQNYKSQTIAERETIISSSITRGFRTALEEFGVRRYKRQSIKATRGFMNVLELYCGLRQSKSEVNYSKATIIIPKFGYYWEILEFIGLEIVRNQIMQLAYRFISCGKTNNLCIEIK